MQSRFHTTLCRPCAPRRRTGSPHLHNVASAAVKRTVGGIIAAFGSIIFPDTMGAVVVDINADDLVSTTGAEVEAAVGAGGEPLAQTAVANTPIPGVVGTACRGGSLLEEEVEPRAVVGASVLTTP